MKINPHIFRGYDIRGIVDKDLNPVVVEHLGRAYGTYLIKKDISPIAVVAHDCRLTGKEYKKALIQGLISTGIDVIDIGMTLVGTFYWSQYYFKAKGGAMITASHNPADYNGFKLATNFSETMVSDEIQEIRQIIETENYRKANKTGSVLVQDVKDAYIQDMQKRVKIIKPLQVVVDPSHSTPGMLIPDLLRQFNCAVIEKNCQIDGSFPLGTPDPTEKIVAERISREVLENHADIGFSYDADGDRIGIVDEKGGIIWNDVLLALFAADVLEKHPGSIIMYNTLCSKVVEDTIRAKGGRPFMWRTGHSFLKSKNKEVKAAFLGELSGHFFFSADFYNHDDGGYTTLRLLEYLSRSNKPLSELVAALPKYISSPEIKLGCADEIKVEFIKKLSIVLKEDFPGAEIIDDERAGDGVRLDLPDSMLVVRYSQNGPYLTVKFEAQTEKKYQEIKQYLSKLLHSYSEVEWASGVNVESLS